MSIDGYLVLKRGDEVIEGETTDHEFFSLKAIEIDSFELGVPRASDSNTDDDLDDSNDPEFTGLQASTKRSLRDSSLKELESFTFSISKQVDSASPDLFFAYCKTHARELHPYDQATVSIRKAGGAKRTESDYRPLTYLKFNFYEVYVVEYGLSLKGDDIASEDITFCFSACQFRYWRQKKSGVLEPAAKTRTWDFAASRKRQMSGD